jgi:uncharacterized protein
MYAVTEAASVLDVPAPAWRPLATDLYASRAWHHFQEIERADAPARCFLAYDRGNELVAALPVYRMRHQPNKHYRLDLLFPQALAGTQEQVLLGNRHGYGNSLLVHPRLTPGERSNACRELAGAVLAWLDRERIGTAWWPYLDHRSMQVLRPLLHDAVPVAQENDCVIPLPGSGFGDYLASLSRGRRDIVKRDRRLFAGAGYEVSARRLSESADIVARLGIETVRKYSGSIDAESARAMTAAQAKVLDDVSTVLVGSRDGQPVAFSLIMDHEGSSYVRTAGFDYARAGSAAEYFELVFYRPIERAYERGITSLSVGISSYRPKVLRGGTLNPRWALPLKAGAWPEAAARQHNKERLREYEEALPSASKEIPYEDYSAFC